MGLQQRASMPSDEWVCRSCPYQEPSHITSMANAKLQVLHALLYAAHLHAVGAQQEKLCSILPCLHPADPGQVSAVVKFRPDELRYRHDLQKCMLR